MNSKLQIFLLKQMKDKDVYAIKSILSEHTPTHRSVKMAIKYKQKYVSIISEIQNLEFIISEIDRGNFLMPWRIRKLLRELSYKKSLLFNNINLAAHKPEDEKSETDETLPASSNYKNFNSEYLIGQTQTLRLVHKNIEDKYDDSLLKKYIQDFIPLMQGIYFIKKDSKIIYIGQAMNIRKRIAIHWYEGKLKEFEFNDKSIEFDWMEVSTYSGTYLNSIEEDLIQKHKPEYNIAQKVSPSFKTMNYAGNFYSNKHGAITVDYDDRGKATSLSKLNKKKAIIGISGKFKKINRDNLIADLKSQGYKVSGDPYSDSINAWILGSDGTIGYKKLRSIKSSDYVLREVDISHHGV